VSSERIRVRPVAGLPLLHLDRPRSQDALRWAKRTFDIIGSATMLAIGAPLMLWAAWQIKRHDGGPVLFRQTRVGRDGDYFTCLKFRSMVLDAESALAELHGEVGYEDGLFKMQRDPRITKPGQWIRRFSIDELPQLVNVLRGHMSLVGPRPPLPLEVDRYTLMQSRRLRVRPGMTGLWQVSGRSDLSWTESIRLDLYYVDNWSMIQDLIILARTMGAVLSSRGAY
jgi:exopolysaccharide biosynthesis polyprenyl glycosylphosphotransferase